MIKTLVNCYTKLLTLLQCQASFSKNHLLREFTIAKVIPIFKGGDSNSINNHTPISLLPVILKIFKIAYGFTYHFYEKHLK